MWAGAEDGFWHSEDILDTFFRYFQLFSVILKASLFQVFREWCFGEIHFFLLGTDSRSHLGAGSQLQQFPRGPAQQLGALSSSSSRSAHLPEEP